METKTCSVCGEMKPLTDFNKDRGRKDGLQYRCKVCHSLMKKNHYIDNKEVVLTRNKQYRQTHGESILANKRKYRSENRGKIRALARKHGALDRQRNPEKHAAKASHRRAAKTQATPSWSNTESITDYYIAAKMFKTYTGNDYHVDHIVPLRSTIVCGLHCEANLQVMLSTDNVSKGNRYWPDMW